MWNVDWTPTVDQWIINLNVDVLRDMKAILTIWTEDVHQYLYPAQIYVIVHLIPYVTAPYVDVSQINPYPSKYNLIKSVIIIKFLFDTL